VSLQLTVCHKHGGRLSLLSARPTVTFPDAQHHHPLAGTKVHCLVMEMHVCEQLAQSRYLKVVTTHWTQLHQLTSEILHYCIKFKNVIQTVKRRWHNHDTSSFIIIIAAGVLCTVKLINVSSSVSKKRATLLW